ncbi:hypothetical protein GW17_00019544 [Ensete ventricosum]|nr:hypothetical protein GW17_00019544 [Ensete ventricosum]
MLLRLGRSVDLKGSERSATVVDLLSFDSEKELVVCRALRDDERWPVQVLSTKRTEQQRLQEGWRQRVADAIVVVHREDGLVQKNALVEELKKPTGSNGGRESRCTRSPMEEEKADALEVSSFDVDERLSFDSKKR